MSKRLTAPNIWRRLATAFACAFLIATAASAQEEPIKISGSRSPDGKLELWIQPGPLDQGCALGTAQIRSVATGKTLDTFDWSGFGEAPDSKAFTVLWRPDCKYFAITWELTRGYVTSAVYGLHRNNRWTEVKLSFDEYNDTIKKMSRVSEFHSGKGYDMAVKWLPDGRLALESVCNDIYYAADGVFKKYAVILQIDDDAREPLQVARVRSIKLEPR
jgi:hypothetical protein